MPGGRGNINGNDGRRFSSMWQPKHRRRSMKFLRQSLIKELNSKEEVIIEGYDLVTGALTKIRVPMPTKRQIIQSLLRAAKRGNVIAIREIFDRIDGKVTESVESNIGSERPINLVFRLQPGNDPISDDDV